MQVQPGVQQDWWFCSSWLTPAVARPVDVGPQEQRFAIALSEARGVRVWNATVAAVARQ